MRDDIHKSVPRPPKIQRWVKYALREADGLAGRSREALEDAVRDVCRREISDDFVTGLMRRVTTGAGDLFGIIAGVQSPRELGGKGSFLERQVLSDCQRTIAGGGEARDSVVEAIAKVLVERSRGDVRAAEPVLLPEGARYGINQMQLDINATDYRSIAAERLGLQEPKERASTTLTADENLLAYPAQREQ